MEAIRFEHITKTYVRGKTRRGDIRQTLQYWQHQWRQPTEKFNALADISFDIRQGDVIGLVGSNGAGKSTLLKLISRITHPTSGRITLTGRVASLLEVGIGFHPELTGRENVFLNGVIHGMSRREMASHFDSIVDFSGIESFIETPVRQYSSGMYIRLAFAVAAHLRSDILLLDEVMGIGDMEFKEKSMAKIRQTIAEGRTIILVSHQTDLIREICPVSMWLDQGTLRAFDKTETVLSQYSQAYASSAHALLSSRHDRQGTGKAILRSIRCVDEQGHILPVIRSGQAVMLEIGIQSDEKEVTNLAIRLDVFNSLGQPCFVLSNNISEGMWAQCPGNATLTCTLPAMPLAEGSYSLDASLNVQGEKSDMLRQAFSFHVVQGQFYKTGRTADFSKGVLVPYTWSYRDE